MPQDHRAHSGINASRGVRVEAGRLAGSRGPRPALRHSTLTSQDEQMGPAEETEKEEQRAGMGK